MAEKILVVDDHPETLEVVSLILRQQGYEVTTVQSALDGLSIAEAQRPDLILLDVMMPSMDGYELCRRLRASPLLTGIPIIMFSVKDQVNDKWAAFEAGADDYLVKPTEPSELLARMQMLLARSARGALTVAAGEATNDSDERAVASMGGKRPQSRPQLRSESLIAVLGVHGGVGTTTVAINLAASLAQNGCPTVLVDLDMVQGHIALYLNQKVQGGLNALARLPVDKLEPELPQCLVQQQKDLQLLLSWPNLDGKQPFLSPEQVRTLLDLLVKPGRCVVVDLGRGFGKMSLPVLARATQVLLCLRPERVSVSSAKRFLRQLHDQLPRNKALHAVMLDYDESAKLPKRAIEEFLQHSLLTVIPIGKHEMAQAVNAGHSLIRNDPESPAAVTFHQLSVQLIR